MARAVIQFYTEASEATLAMDRDFFRRRSPLPPKAVEAYVDPERGFRHITDPEQVGRLRRSAAASRLTRKEVRVLRLAGERGL